MSDLIATATKMFAENQVFAGIISAGAVGFVGYQARALPAAAWAIAKSQSTVTLTIHSDQPTFPLVDVWLSRHPAAKKARRLTTVSRFEGPGEGEHALTLGSGPHLIRQNGRFWLVQRDSEGPGQSAFGGPPNSPAPGVAGQRRETITIQTLGRDPAIFDRFIKGIAEEIARSDDVSVYAWTHGYFQLTAKRPKRPLETVFMDGAQRRALLDDLNLFLSRREWYAERGIPWHRGVMLKGPPGTGKTSLIFAIAGVLQKPIYLINPSTMQAGDAELHMALTAARGGIVVLEDADAISAARDRTAPKEAEPVVLMQGREITLSGLLNAIDGMGSAEGRILFITTNAPELLDAALVRPGRIDRVEHLGLADLHTALAMFRRYWPQGDETAFVRTIAPRLPLSPAEIQNILLGGALAEQIAEAA